MALPRTPYSSREIRPERRVSARAPHRGPAPYCAARLPRLHEEIMRLLPKVRLTPGRFRDRRLCAPRPTPDRLSRAIRIYQFRARHLRRPTLSIHAKSTVRGQTIPVPDARSVRPARANEGGPTWEGPSRGRGFTFSPRRRQPGGSARRHPSPTRTWASSG